MNNLIAVKNLSKTYGDIQAVDSVSFDVKEKEFLAIQGQSGSGKSTLLGLLTGLERADAGKILLDDKELTELGEEELALFRRKNIGIVFQSFNLIPTLDAAENIALPLFPLGIARDDMMNRAQIIAKDVDLEHRLDHYPNELSGGEQQRVAIARALINEPKVVFADEPTGNLDSKTGEKITRLLRDLNKDMGLTVVMVTHDDSIAKSSDRVLKMKDGRLHDE